MSEELGFSRDPHWMEEAEQTVHAIRQGAVDAFVVEELQGHRVYALESADLPYYALVERMQQCAAMLNSRGEIIYCNFSLGELLGVTREDVVGIPLAHFVETADQSSYEKLWAQIGREAVQGQFQLRRCDGELVPVACSLALLSGDQTTAGVLITDLTPQRHQVVLARRLLQVQDEERRRIARDLHDSAGQLLAAVSMNLDKIAVEAAKLSPEAALCVRQNIAMVQEINNEIRTISHLLHPPMLEEAGLPSVLRWLVDGFAQRSNIQTTLEISEDFQRLPPAMELAVFRVIQECLTNVHRHSGSLSCTVKIVRGDDQVRIEIRDRGRGIPNTHLSNLPASSGVGIRGARERIQQLGGTLEIASSPEGTTITATLPVSAPDSNGGRA
ncbi:MAG TPA: ATP-binding protein [Anaerolineales bacterium]